MRKENKAIIIEEIANIISSYNTVYVADISGLTVEKSNELRKLCFKKGVRLKMVKNTPLKKDFYIPIKENIDYQTGLYLKVSM